MISMMLLRGVTSNSWITVNVGESGYEPVTQAKYIFDVVILTVMAITMIWFLYYGIKETNKGDR